MTADIGASCLLAVIATVLLRVALLSQRGIAAMNFGKTDRSDFLIPPFALFYVYLVLANAFGWPTVAHATLFGSAPLRWLGAALCVSAVALMIASIVSFGVSFRVGIDAERPGGLVTGGVFAYTRNPIYVAFGFMLLGQFLIQPALLLLAYALAGVALFHRQVLREEAFLEKQYGAEFRAYAAHVRRYL
jgi:protein-S-isoprenylcysteine O-methyltransferase Ste14